MPAAVALIHHPVIDRHGEVVTTAVTNLDLHDIARAARTYGLGRFYVVTPVAAQQALVQRILDHWRQGYGAVAGSDRANALDLVEVVGSFDDARRAWESRIGAAALPVLTGAARQDGISFAGCRTLSESQSLLLVFGTGWGLAPSWFGHGATVLEPVAAGSAYNHLSVRSAAAIIFDRLFGA